MTKSCKYNRNASQSMTMKSQQQQKTKHGKKSIHETAVKGKIAGNMKPDFPLFAINFV